MSAFPFIAAAGIGGGLNVLGGVLSGEAESDEAKARRAALRAQQRKAAQHLHAAQFGTLAPSELSFGGRYAGFPAAARLALAEYDRLLNDPSTPAPILTRLAKERDRLASRFSFHGPPPTIGEAGLRALYAEDAPARLSEFDRIAALQAGQSAAARSALAAQLGALAPRYDELVAQAMAFGPEARRAAQAAFENAVREGTAEVVRSAAARGIGQSSIPENARLAVYARGGAGLSQALADIEARRAALVQNAMRERLSALEEHARMLTGFDISEAARMQNMLGQRFGVFSQLADRPLSSWERSVQLAASGFQPSALYPGAGPAASQTALGNIGQSLAGIGSTVAGYGLYNLFSRAGREPAAPSVTPESMLALQLASRLGWPPR